MSERGRKEGGVFFIFAGGRAAYPALVQHPVFPLRWYTDQEQLRNAN